jgi:hypothetical protein
VNDHVAEPFRTILNAVVRPEPIEAPLPATVRDLRKYRRIESDVCQELALELQDSGVQIDAGQVAWILATGQFTIRRRVEREGK